MKRESKDSSASAGANARAAERYRLNLPTMMWELGSLRESAIPTQTVDISRSGMFLSGKFPLRPGSMISFEVKLPPVGDQPGGTMVGQATVIRNDSTGTGRVGIGALIHQCEVWPANRPTAGARAAAQFQSGGGNRTAKPGEKRSGKERRKNDRAASPPTRERTVPLATERRRKARRGLGRGKS
jgi:hypothetical protein